MVQRRAGRWPFALLLGLGPGQYNRHFRGCFRFRADLATDADLPLC
jgi:hypothetical protein